MLVAYEIAKELDVDCARFLQLSVTSPQATRAAQIALRSTMDVNQAQMINSTHDGSKVSVAQRRKSFTS